MLRYLRGGWTSPQARPRSPPAWLLLRIELSACQQCFVQLIPGCQGVQGQCVVGQRAGLGGIERIVEQNQYILDHGACAAQAATVPALERPSVVTSSTSRTFGVVGQSTFEPGP